MKNFLALLLFTFISIEAITQERIRFSLQNFAGLLTGENGSGVQFQTISGIRYKKWNAGIGTGIDGYYSFSSPVFLSLNRSIFKRGKNDFSLSINGGINLPWKNVQNHYESFWGYKITKLTGAYWQGCVNYGISLGKRKHILLAQAGFSYKHMGEIMKQTVINPPSPGDQDTYRYDYYLKTLSF